MNKVISTDLGAKTTTRGAGAKRTQHKVFTDWCRSRTSDFSFAVGTKKKDLEAKLVQLGASSEVVQAKVDGLAASDETPEADLKASSVVRQKTHENFETSEKLLDIIDTLARAIRSIEK